jgi:hypothetical protein
MKRLGISLALLFAGCSREPLTPITDKVEKDGAGDVRSASAESIQQWMQRKGPEYSRAIWAMCEPVQKNAPATWGDSTEGRVCKAANAVRFWGRGNVGSDPRKY